METTPELETRTLLQHEEPPSMEDVQFLVSLRVDSSAQKPQIIISFYCIFIKSYQWSSTWVSLSHQ